MFQMKIDKKTGTLDLFQNGTLIGSLEKEEARTFITETQNEWTNHAFIFQKDNWTQITIEQILEEIPSLDVFCGINFVLDGEYICSVEVVRKESSAVRRRMGEHIHEIWDDQTYVNFKAKHFYFGKMTNHHLRACLADEVLNFIENTSGFKIYVNGMEQNIYVFFDEEKTIDYTEELNHY